MTPEPFTRFQLRQTVFGNYLKTFPIPHFDCPVNF